MAQEDKNCNVNRIGWPQQLCLGGHSHIQLRGRSQFHRMNWTRVAQTYPRRLCARVAGAMGKAAGLTRCVRNSLDVAGCSRCGSLRVGEASNPGPRKWAHTGKPRDPTGPFGYSPCGSKHAITPRESMAKFSSLAGEDVFPRNYFSDIHLCSTGGSGAQALWHTPLQLRKGPV